MIEGQGSRLSLLDGGLFRIYEIVDFVVVVSALINYSRDTVFEGTDVFAAKTPGRNLYGRCPQLIPIESIILIGTYSLSREVGDDILFYNPSHLYSYKVTYRPRVVRGGTRSFQANLEHQFPVCRVVFLFSCTSGEEGDCCCYGYDEKFAYFHIPYYILVAWYGIAGECAAIGPGGDG